MTEQLKKVRLLLVAQSIEEWCIAQGLRDMTRHVRDIRLALRHTGRMTTRIAIEDPFRHPGRDDRGHGDLPLVTIVRGYSGSGYKAVP
jgi:hypothetical protein